MMQETYLLMRSRLKSRISRGAEDKSGKTKDVGNHLFQSAKVPRWKSLKKTKMNLNQCPKRSKLNDYELSLLDILRLSRQIS